MVSWGQVGLSFAVGALTSGLAAEGMLAGELQTVTHWGPEGMTALRTGDWVMTGSQSVRNYGLSGVVQNGYSLSSAVTTQVSRSSLSWPSGWEFVKGFWGQRIYNGATTAAAAATGAAVDAGAMKQAGWLAAPPERSGIVVASRPNHMRLPHKLLVAFLILGVLLASYHNRWRPCEDIDEAPRAISNTALRYLCNVLYSSHAVLPYRYSNRENVGRFFSVHNDLCSDRGLPLWVRVSQIARPCLAACLFQQGRFQVYVARGVIRLQDESKRRTG